MVNLKMKSLGEQGSAIRELFEYGKARKKIIGEDEVITYRPADDLLPEFKNLKKQYKHIAKTDEDVLSIALFNDVAIKFLEKKKEESKTETIRVSV